MNLTELFNKIYSKIENKNSFLVRAKYYSVQRYFVRILANIILPIYFYFTQNNPSYKLGKSSKQSGRLIVSLTSFPKRIGKVWLVVETMLRQTLKPDKLILWLSIEQFPSLDVLPEKLLEQQKRGLEIALVAGDIRSHKKYYYALKKYPEDYIVTIDDDIFYSPNLIQKLHQCSLDYPNNVCCTLVNKIKFIDSKVAPFNSWERRTKETGFTGGCFMLLSGSGCLFPPHSLHPDVTRKDLSQKLAPTADDIWLSAMTYANTNKIIKADASVWIFMPILSNADMKLCSNNQSNGIYDKQIQEIEKFCRYVYHKNIWKEN